VKPELARHVADALPGTERSVVREYLQARMLQSIGLAGHLTSVAFMGGTALRVLFMIPRYSEDLDFALEHNADEFDFDELVHDFVRPLEREGYAVEIARKSFGSAVDKAFVKFPGLLHELGLSPHASESMSVKVEVDTNPPAGAVCQVSDVRRFVPLRIYHHDKASLFGGKLAAVLMRQYTKGRDLYDLLWYTADPTWPAPNLELLRNAVAQGGWEGPVIGPENWKGIVLSRLGTVDWDKARTEARQFVITASEVDLLSHETFERLLAPGH